MQMQKAAEAGWSWGWGWGWGEEGKAVARRVQGRTRAVKVLEAKATDAQKNSGAAEEGVEAACGWLLLRGPCCVAFSRYEAKDSGSSWVGAAGWA